MAIITQDYGSIGGGGGVEELYSETKSSATVNTWYSTGIKPSNNKGLTIVVVNNSAGNLYGAYTVDETETITRVFNNYIEVRVNNGVIEIRATYNPSILYFYVYGVN